MIDNTHMPGQQLTTPATKYHLIQVNYNPILFRSTKYSVIMSETPPAPPAPPVNPPIKPQHSSTEQDSSPSLDPSCTQLQPVSHPAATSSPQPESHSQAGEATASLGSNQESGPVLYLSESLQESADGVEKTVSDSGEEPAAVPTDQSQAAVVPDSETRQVESVTGVVPEAGSSNSAAQEPLIHTKPKKDKFARLKELGLDPPPIAKLCPDDGAFIELEAPQLNPGESWFFLYVERCRNKNV